MDPIDIDVVGTWDFGPRCPDCGSPLLAASRMCRTTCFDTEVEAWRVECPLCGPATIIKRTHEQVKER